MSGHTLYLVRCSLCAILDSRVRWKPSDAPLICIGCSPGRLNYGLDYKGNICGSKHGDPDLSDLDSKPSPDYHVVQNIELGMSTVSCYGMPWDSGLPESFMIWYPGIQLRIFVNYSCLGCLRSCTGYEKDYNAVGNQEATYLVKAEAKFTYYMVALLLSMMNFLLEIVLLYLVAQDSLISHSYAQCKRAHFFVGYEQIMRFLRMQEQGKGVALNNSCSAMLPSTAPITYSHFLPGPWQPAKERYEHASTARGAIVEPPLSAIMLSNRVVACSYSVMWCLADASLRLLKWWSDTQCVQPSSASFEALFSAERSSTGIPVQVWVVRSVLNLFWSKAAPSSLLTDFPVVGHQLKSIWGAECVPCCVLEKSIKEEKSEKLFHICAAANLAMRLCWAETKPFTQVCRQFILYPHDTLKNEPTYSAIIASCNGYNPSYASVFNWRFGASGVFRYDSAWCQWKVAWPSSLGLGGNKFKLSHVGKTGARNNILVRIMNHLTYSIEDLLGGSHVAWHLSFVLFDMVKIWKVLPSLQPKVTWFLSSQVILQEVVVVISPVRKLCSSYEKAVLLFVHHVLKKIELWQWRASPGQWELHMCDRLHTIAVVEGITSSMFIASLLEHLSSYEELGYTSDGQLSNVPYDLVQIGLLARFTTPTVFLGDTLLNFYGCCSSALVATTYCLLYNKRSSFLGAELIAYSRILEFNQAHFFVRPWDPGILHFLSRTEVIIIRKRNGCYSGGLAHSQKSGIEQDCNLFHQMLVNVSPTTCPSLRSFRCQQSAILFDGHAILVTSWFVVAEASFTRVLRLRQAQFQRRGSVMSWVHDPSVCRLGV